MHGLPDPERVSLSCQCTRSREHLQTPERGTPHLHQDRREREQARPRFLRRLWHGDLCGRTGRSDVLYAAVWNDQAAGRVSPDATNLASLGDAVVVGLAQDRKRRPPVANRGRGIDTPTSGSAGCRVRATASGVRARRRLSAARAAPIRTARRPRASRGR